MATTRTGPSVGRGAPDTPAGADVTAARPPTPTERDLEAAPVATNGAFA